MRLLEIRERKKQNKTKPFSGIETAQAIPPLSHLELTDVFDVPREDLGALEDFKLSEIFQVSALTEAGKWWIFSEACQNTRGRDKHMASQY